ncbi:hypothetical protein ACFL4G_07350 [Thermodesulfobacteriota bacterium]
MSKTFLASGSSSPSLTGAEQVAHPQGRGAQEVRHQGDPVPVANDHLHERFDPLLFENLAAGE